MKILFFNNGVINRGEMSGSDRRSIHWARHFAKKHDVDVVIPSFATDRFLAPIQTVSISHTENVAGLGEYLQRTFKGLTWVWKNRKKDVSVVYSTSDLIPDSIPALFFRLLNPSVTWMTGLHLIAPNPFYGFEGQSKKRFHLPTLKGLYYFLTQTFILFFAKRLAKLVFVSNQQDRETLLKRGFRADQIMVTYGSPDWENVPQPHAGAPENYVCFIARYHPQKGYNDMIAAWSHVLKTGLDAKLVILGNIPQDDLDALLVKHGVPQGNVEFLGFLDGPKKFAVLSKATALAFPSHYESFGMVAVEAQAVGVPVVAYDLAFYGDIYPQGMVRIELGDTVKFAHALARMFEDQPHRDAVAKAAFENAQRFDFTKTGQDILDRLEGK